jgi:hypothetical protein
MPKHKVMGLYAVPVAALFATELVHAQSGGSGLEGVWSTTVMTSQHPAWLIEDHLCGFVCSPEEYEYLHRLLRDPANDKRSLQQLQQDMRTFGNQRVGKILTDAARERLAAVLDRGDTSRLCEPPDLRVAAVASPLPLAIRLHDGNIILHQQHWNVVRSIRLANESPTPNGPPSLYGNATARFEGATLVVESVNLLPMMTGESLTTDQARVTERYTLSEDGSRLDMELTIDDPATYREPRVWYQPRIRTPDVQLVEDDPCAGLREQD